MNRARLITLISVLLFLVALGNGAVPYLQRIGVLNHAGYVAAVANYCRGDRGGPLSLERGCTCMHKDALVAGEWAKGPDASFNFAGPRIVPKLAKDVLFAGTILFSVFLLRRRGVLAELHNKWPVTVFLGLVALGLVIALVRSGPNYALAALRPFEFLGLALFGAWLAEGMPALARALGILILVETVLVAIELAWGMPLRPCPYSFRASGTMIWPNSLGIITVVALALNIAFLPERRWLALLLLATVAILVSSGSGTGWIALFLMLCWWLPRAVGSRRRAALGAALLLLGALLLLALPAVTHRPDIYDSLLARDGRADRLREVVVEATPVQRVFGQGLGVRSNIIFSLFVSDSKEAAAIAGPTEPRINDSTLVALFAQLGVLGTSAFYLLMAWAARRDREARPLWLVLMLVSLTVNLIEIFPINFLLGVLLARGFGPTRPVGDEVEGAA